MIRIYPSSRYTRAQMWITLAKENQLHYIAQWIKHVEYQDTTEDYKDATKYWPANLRDIKDCDIVLAYAEKEDCLGGTLIEIGAALACEKPILLIGDNESFRCWTHHPLIERHNNLYSAIQHIKFLETI